MALSTWLENSIIDHVLRDTAMPTYATLYLGLFLTDPTDADVGDEVSGGDYERQSISFLAAAAGETFNEHTITFPMATADWGLIRYVGIYTAQSGGILLLHAPLTSDVLVLTGQTFSVPAEQLQVVLK